MKLGVSAGGAGHLNLVGSEGMRPQSNRRSRRRYAPLSARQLDVLRWIADGCPDRDWPDHTHKVTASALAGRGLVTVRRRAKRWGAVVTENGRYYLEHGVYPGQTTPVPRSSARRRQPAAGGTAEQLLAQIEADGGHMILHDSPSHLRTANQHAVGKFDADGLVADGREFRICLDGAGGHDRPRARSVFEEVSTRAMVIGRAIAGACIPRGLGFGRRPRDEPSLQITIAAASRFTLSQDHEKREPVADEPAAMKHAWQRVPGEDGQVRSGRLVLRLDVGHRSFSWANQPRWILRQKPPAIFQEIIQRATAPVAERRRQVEERRRQVEERRRREEWEAAVKRARIAYVEELNRGRLRLQFDQYVQAEGIRVYCAQLDDLAMESPDLEEAGHIRQWAAWAREEADRIDPTRHPEQLEYVVPADVREPDMQEPVQLRMSVWRPPD